MKTARYTMTGDVATVNKTNPSVIFQSGGNGGNIKFLEPSNIASTLVHMDVRIFSKQLLMEN